MSHSLASPSGRESRVRSFMAAGLAGALLLWPAVGESASGDPFAAFLGSWQGSGRILADDGHSERLGCRATYSASGSGAALTLSLVCASASTRFDVQAYVEAEGRSLRGHWEETTRSASGHVTGQLAGGDLEANVVGPGFTAAMSIRSNERRQAVDIRPTAGGITDVQVTLSRLR